MILYYKQKTYTANTGLTLYHSNFVASAAKSSTLVIVLRSTSTSQNKITLKVTGLPTTKVFAKAGQDNVTSAICKHQQRFGLDVQCSAFCF